MKKLILCLFYLIFISNIFYSESFFYEKRLPLGISLNSNNGEIAFFVYRNDSDYEIIWEGSGYLISLANFSYDDNYLYLSFYKIWIGAEVINSNDKRYIYKYMLKISKNMLIDNIIKFSDITPVLILEDSAGSVAKHSDFPKYFSTKKNSYIYEKAIHDSKKVCSINQNDTFSIMDIVPSEETKDEIWLKINSNGTTGYIPLSSLADDWKVVVNKLDNFVDVSKIPAFCNDKSVRIRTAPSLESQTLGYLNINDKVFIKGYSENKQEIDNENWYWNEVELLDGTSGWVYGKYLDIEE